MSPIKLKDLLLLLQEYTETNKKKLEIILVGGLALHYYGMDDRFTIDVDGEIVGDQEGLFFFLKSKNIPSDLTENFSGWSIVQMPKGYRERSSIIFSNKLLKVKVLDPVDYVISKLRRFTEEDIEDALYVIERFRIDVLHIKNMVDEAVKNSPKDTMLFIFKKNYEILKNKIQQI